MSRQVGDPNGEDRGVGRIDETGDAVRSNRAAVGVMLVAVFLQVLGAVLLKTLADVRTTLTIGLIAAGIGAVLALNLLRLGVWGLAHSRYPLSTTFPLSSLFFPAMLAVAAAFGDVIGFRQILGAVLITAGAFWLSARTQQ